MDFKALRKSLSFERVLEHYGVTIKRRKGNRHSGFCPLPTHQGKRKSPSFSAKLDVGVWQCFGCRASGNILDFAIRMEGLDPSEAQNVRTVALKLQALFGKPAGSPPQSTKTPPANPVPSKNLPVILNPPLDFALQDLDIAHPYLASRGFLPETIQHFGLGYCNRGLMKGRIAIPLHDDCDNLVGYAGRLVDDSAVNESTPKYKFPSARQREGKLLEFRKSLLLYNLNRLKWPLADLIICEGFASIWWLTQHGYPNWVALMGNSCSQDQARLILSSVQPVGCIWIMTDADPGGEQCAQSIFVQIAPHRLVRWVKLPKGQPTDYTPGDLSEMLWPI